MSHKLTWKYFHIWVFKCENSFDSWSPPSPLHIHSSYIYELSRLNSLNDSFYTVRDINTSFVWTLRVESNGSKWVIKCLFFAMFICNDYVQTLGLTCITFKNITDRVWRKKSSENSWVVIFCDFCECNLAWQLILFGMISKRVWSHK